MVELRDYVDYVDGGYLAANLILGFSEYLDQQRLTASTLEQLKTASRHSWCSVSLGTMPLNLAISTGARTKIGQRI